MSSDTKENGICRIECGCKILFPECDLDRGILNKPCDVHRKIDAIAQLRLVYIVAAKLRELRVVTATDIGNVEGLDAAGNAKSKRPPISSV